MLQTDRTSYPLHELLAFGKEAATRHHLELEGGHDTQAVP